VAEKQVRITVGADICDANVSGLHPCFFQNDSVGIPEIKMELMLSLFI
jgi:hypothetical protein